MSVSKLVFEPQGLLKFGFTGRPTFQKKSRPPADKTPNQLLANDPNGS
jgi:hypothetical protein